MAEYTFTTVPGKLKELFSKIQTVGVPPTASITWLSSIGFTSSNDRSVLPVLKLIGFLDTTGKPTTRWQNYRNKSIAGKELADGIRTGYKDLFNTYSDANNRTDDELKNFFRTKSSAGDQAISKTVNTFRQLCNLADFNISDASHTSNSTETDIKPSTSPLVPSIAVSPIRYQESHAGVTININIELSLPATTDEKIYDSLFAALKRHVLSGGKPSDN